VLCTAFEVEFSCFKQVVPQILESTPFAFSIDVAVSASRKYALNLEKWLFDNLNKHHTNFFQVGIMSICVLGIFFI
jgi:hypothetical protein